MEEAEHEDDKPEESVFRKIAQSDNDKENLVVWRGEQVFVTMNLYPYNKGHLLVIPYRQVEFFDELAEKEQQAVMQTVDQAMQWLKEALSPDGFHVGMNLGKAAGAGIPEHLHVHVLPRWEEDTRFTAAAVDTEAVPEKMQEIYRLLRQVVQNRDTF